MPEHVPNAEHSPPTRRSLLESVAHSTARWGEFDLQYRPLMLKIARNAGLDHHDAQDAVQEAYGTLLRRLPQFVAQARIGSFRRYLAKVVKSRAMDIYRSQHRLRSADPIDESDAVEGSLQPVAPGPQPDQVASDVPDAIDRAMAVLAKRMKNRDLSVLQHFLIREWDARRVAKAHGIEEDHVFQIVRRQKLALYREFIRQLDGPESSLHTRIQTP